MKRKCTVCKEDKNSEDFFFKNKAKQQLHSHCKQCYKNKKSLYMDEHYRKYGSAYRIRARIRKTKIKRMRQDQLFAFLKGKSCEHCGFSDIRTLEFDHKDPESKSFGIARAITTGYSWELILAEISKCSILCSNCHKIKTAEEQKWRKRHLGGVVTQGSAKPQRPVQFR